MYYQDNLKNIWSSMLTEGQNENQAKAILKKANKEDLYDSLLALTDKYKTNPAAKNNKHLPVLTKWLLDGTQLSTIQYYYDKFVDNNSINQKPIDTFSFQDFEQLVDSSFKSNISIKNKEINDKPVYEDENVKIFLGDDKEKCMKYGQGSKYNFCISRTDAANMFNSYRLNQNAAFYFIYFKNSEAQRTAPTELIVIHAYPKDSFKINYATPNVDRPISKEDILKQFPSLKPAFDHNIFKNMPLSDKEMYIRDTIDQARSILDLKSIDDQLMFIEMGKRIKPNEWTFLGDRTEILLKKAVEVSYQDIPITIINNFPKLKERYIQKLKQRLDIKIENEAAYEITKHEVIYAGKDNQKFYQFLKRYEDLYTDILYDLLEENKNNLDNIPDWFIQADPTEVNIARLTSLYVYTQTVGILEISDNENFKGASQKLLTFINKFKPVIINDAWNCMFINKILIINNLPAIPEFIDTLINLNKKLYAQEIVKLLRQKHIPPSDKLLNFAYPNPIS